MLNEVFARSILIDKGQAKRCLELTEFGRIRLISRVISGKRVTLDANSVRLGRDPVLLFV